MLLGGLILGVVIFYGLLAFVEYFVDELEKP